MMRWNGHWAVHVITIFAGYKDEVGEPWFEVRKDGKFYRRGTHRRAAQPGI